MSRAPLLSEEAAAKAAEDVGLPAQLAKLNIFRVMLHQPPAAKGLADLILSLIFRGDLDDRLRELVIMRIGWATGSEYEWTQHWPLALDQFGCSEQDLLSLRDWRASDHFGPAERAVLAATDETLETGTISDATWAECEAQLPDTTSRIELVAAIGCWHLVSQLTRGLAIPLEDGVASWPPDGKRP